MCCCSPWVLWFSPSSRAFSQTCRPQGRRLLPFRDGPHLRGVGAGWREPEEYLAKSLQHYQDALKLDPSATLVFEELTDLYIQTNRLRDAVAQAEDILQKNPDNVDARRMLGRIYMRMISTADNRINEEYLKKAIEQLQKVTEKSPKDADSWVLLGRLYGASNNSVESEKAYNKALEADPESEDALTGLPRSMPLWATARGRRKLKAAADKSPNERTLMHSVRHTKNCTTTERGRSPGARARNAAREQQARPRRGGKPDARRPA